MKYLAAYCLAALGGKTDIGAKDVKSILESVGAEIDDGRVNSVIEALKGKNLHEVISAGMGKVGSLSFGGGGSSSGASTTAAKTETKTEKKEEAKEDQKDQEENQSNTISQHHYRKNTLI
jgi:large subunit ribosomal protein LP2